MPLAHAGDSWWHGVVSSTWEGGENWYDAAPPNGNVLPTPAQQDVAIFADGALSDFVDISDNRQVRQLTFQANTLRYQLNIMEGGMLNIQGGGINRVGRIEPLIHVDAGGSLKLTGESVVSGDGTFVDVDGAFSIEERASIIDFALSVRVHDGGRFELLDEARAGAMTISAEPGSFMFVRDKADGQRATVIVSEGSQLFLSGALGHAGDGIVRFRNLNSYGEIDLGSKQLNISSNCVTFGKLNMSFKGKKTGFIRGNGDTWIRGTLAIRGKRTTPNGRYILLKSFGKLKGKFKKLEVIGFGPKRKAKLEYNRNTRTVILHLK